MGEWRSRENTLVISISFALGSAFVTPKRWIIEWKSCNKSEIKHDKVNLKKNTIVLSYDVTDESQKVYITDSKIEQDTAIICLAQLHFFRFFR